jgi:hypothetical protein
MAGQDRQARLVLPASGAAPARVRVIHRSPGGRAARAAVALVGSWLLMPAVFFVPPHLLWPVLVFGAGLAFGWREWRGEYVVESFEGSCPRCGQELSMKEGARIRGRQRVECYGCHREPELVLDDSDG